MSERVFTEDQWRAIAEIERRSEDRFEYRTPPHSEKRLYGPRFSDGEYFIALWLCDAEYELRYGPPTPSYRVYEKQSNLFLTWGVTDRVNAIQGARERIGLIPADYWSEMLAQAKAEMAEHRAELEAEEAIRKAKAVKKPRKVGKRARAVFEASAGKCHYCATALDLTGKWHIEHKIPRALFGGSEQSNLVAACAPCNHAKRDKTDLEFMAEQRATTNEQSA